MGIGYFNKNTATEYEEFEKEANMTGEKLAPYGGCFTYHNHTNEFAILEDGRKGWNILVDGLNPKNTSFVLDTYWIANPGVKYFVVEQDTCPAGPFESLKISADFIRKNYM